MDVWNNRIFDVNNRWNLGQLVDGSMLRTLHGDDNKIDTTVKKCADIKRPTEIERNAKVTTSSCIKLANISQSGNNSAVQQNYACTGKICACLALITMLSLLDLSNWIIHKCARLSPFSPKKCSRSYLDVVKIRSSNMTFSKTILWPRMSLITKAVTYMSNVLGRKVSGTLVRMFWMMLIQQMKLLISW